MPEPPIDIDPRQAERLDRAIDQIIAGGNLPASGDARLDPLVALAARLHRDLPRDLPDPAFRSRLKDDLTGRLPIIQPATPRVSPFSRLPIYGSLAAVFVLAVAAGVMAVWLGGRDESPTTATSAKLMQVTAVATTHVLAPASATGSGSVVTRTAESTVTITAALLLPTATIAPVGTAAPTVTPEPPAAPSAQPTQPTQPPAQASATVLRASLPAIDAATIEHGPVPAADGGGPAPSSGVTYFLDAEPASLGDSVTVYHLSPPAEDPVTFCRDLAAKAGIPTDDVHAADASGRTEVFAGTPDSGSLYWRPDAGVFQFSSAATGGQDDLRPDAIAERAAAWLDAIGYPTAMLGGPHIDDFGDLWQVSYAYAGLPTPGIGYPLGVSVMLQDDGTVAEARGYWLAADSQETVELVSVADAWDSVTHGGGYWLDGGISSAGGEFHADAVTLASVLTNTGGDLVLQPVVKFSGTFIASDGTTASISVFARATYP